ncbi:MAG TPA: c-type cytochrome [Candidatus Dormibacteraeota bacterium]|nr:c-type cytochrome [Candidatus Dormibacteraeota bacterium]
MMRGTPGMRLTLGLLSPLFLLVCAVAIRSEDTKPWMSFQEEFTRIYVERATAKLHEAEVRNDANAVSHWQRAIAERRAAPPTIAQTYLDDVKVADRCVTCHQGIDNPLFADAPQPFRTHPGDLLKTHDPSRFGCSLCHQGQGAATTVEGGHGREANWLAPLLPTAYVQASCARCHESTHGLAGADHVRRGVDLFLQKGCYGCHGVEGITYLPKFGPPLTPIKSKLADPDRWVFAWVKGPQRVSPDTTMPDFKFSDDDVGKITAFLLALPAPKPLPRVVLDGASAEEGERLFTERGCRGCHAVRADEHSVSPRVPHLAGIGSKVTAEWLDRWIADPKAYNSDTAMPKVALSDEERHHIVAYLLSLKRSEPLPSAPDVTRFDPEDGKQLVRRYECFGCHVIEGFDKVRTSVPNLGEFARKPIDEFDFGRTIDVPRTKWDWLDRKLRDPRAYETDTIKLRMPSMPMSDDERADIIAAVLGADGPDLPAHYRVAATPAQRALREQEWMIAHLNCNGCHRVEGRDAHLARYIERKNMLAPSLEGVGARLQGQYLYQFLLEPKQVRPWLTLRMPNFGFSEGEVQNLVAGLAAAAKVANPYTYVARESVAPERLQRGVRRFSHYKCVQCHPTSIDQGLPEGVDPEDLSINLMLAKTRLRPEWIRDFLERPKQIAGLQTRMPTVFYTVDGAPKVEKPREDIDDITAYLMTMSEPPEATLQAEEEARKAEGERQQAVDWSNVQY